MNVCRPAALAVAACLAGLSLTACSGGIVTPGSSSSTPPPNTSPSNPAASNPDSNPDSGTGASSPPASTPPAGSPSGPGGTVSVGGGLGSFPVPPGATVVENVSNGTTIDIVLSSVSPQEVSSFYGSALPAAGYTVTQNTQASGAAVTGTAVEFTGHGYKGDIGAVSSLGITGLSALGGLAGNVIGITLTPQS
jgi:hypothetical protein